MREMDKGSFLCSDKFGKKVGLNNYVRFLEGKFFMNF